jgi:hypothetical protein
MSNTAENIREITVSQPASSGALTPMDMLSHAVERGADLDMIEKLMNLQERWEASQARKAFDEAISAAKADIPPIERTGKGHNDKRYATSQPSPGSLTRSSRSMAFPTASAPRREIGSASRASFRTSPAISRKRRFQRPPDASGSKNAIQAIGSTLTYLQRYSLVQMLGLAAADDDDGKASHGGATITEDQAADLVALADDVGADRAKFCKYFKVESFSALPASRFQAAVDALNAKRKA